MIGGGIGTRPVGPALAGGTDARLELPVHGSDTPGRNMLPPAAAPFVAFAQLLRRHGFPIASEQVTGFLAAIALLGPRSLDDVRAAALAMLAPGPERLAAFDMLFRVHFLGEQAAAVAGGDEDETQIHDDGGARPAQSVEEAREGGELSSAEEVLGLRRFAATADGLAGLRSDLAASLPTRRSLRSVRARSGGRPDLRRALRELVRNDGDLPLLPLRRRLDVPRRIVLLIDVSGSMRAHTEDHLCLAHAVVQATGSAEVFAFGTHLTRITTPLRLRDRNHALDRAARLVEDWDGGTRIGPALLAFLAVPRFAAYARGAAVVVLSDALERGDPADLTSAMRRLAARAHRLSLATPLAADPRFRPQTAALAAILQCLDDLVDGSSVEALSGFLLSLARPAPRAATVWRTMP